MAQDLAADARFRPPAFIPPERPLPYFEAMRRLFDNPIEAWPRAVYEEPYFRRGDGRQTFLYVTDPAMLKAVLLDQAESFPKDYMFRRVVGPAFGEGLLTSEGPEWRWQRRAAAPGFRHDLILQMTPAMTAAAERALGRWRDRPPQVRDVAAEMTRITFDVILTTMLSGGEGVDVDQAARRIEDYLETLGGVTVADVLGLPTWMRQAMAPRGRLALVWLRRMVERMISRRRREPQRGDLVDLLMQARDPETGRAMDDALLRDNLLTFIGAGHETTALALTWSLYLLASDPPSARRLREEVSEVAGEATIGAAHVPQLVFTRQVVEEAMRLFPPLPIMTRMAAEDVEIPGLKVGKGTFVFIPIYAIHRHRRLWEDPEAFDPARFAPDAAKARPRFAYLPFGGGPRICIGAAFAMTEAVAILATLMRGADFAPLPDRTVRPRVRISLRPEGGLPLAVTPRAETP